MLHNSISPTISTIWMRKEKSFLKALPLTLKRFIEIDLILSYHIIFDQRKMERLDPVKSHKPEKKVFILSLVIIITCHYYHFLAKK